MEHETTKLFPDAPLSGYDVRALHWQKGAGKPLTLTEKKAILGDAYMIPANVTNLKPVKHEPTVRVISRTTVDGATTEHVAIGAYDQPADDAPIALSAAIADDDVRHVVMRDETTPVCMDCGKPWPMGLNAGRCFNCHQAAFAPEQYPAEAVARVVASQNAERPCPNCGTPAEPDDRFCGHCGVRLAHDAATSLQTWPTSTHHFDATAPTREELYGDEPAPGYVPIARKYTGKNPDRILAACPHATDVRGFNDWLKVGRCVMKGQKGIQIFTPNGGPGEDADGVIDERRPRVRKAYVFDISQTAPIAPKAPRASQSAGSTYAAAD